MGGESDAPRLVAHWKSAAADLGLELEAPFEWTLASGRRIRVPVRLRNFGGVQGMLIFARSSALDGAGEELIRAGFGYSVMSEPRSADSYTRSGALDVLSDWGWTGARADRPVWLPRSQIRAGTREKFGIEAVVEWEAEPDWIFGRIDVWVGGVRLGHDFGGTALNGCRNWLAALAKDEVDRRVHEFLDLSASELVLACRRAVFVDGGPEPLLQNIGRCELGSMFMDALEACEIYLLETSDGRDRIVWAVCGSAEANESVLPGRSVRQVAAEFVEKFDAAR